MWQDTSSVLFSAQRLDRIDKCRAARGQITGEQGYECEKQGNGDKGNRICCLHAEKKVGQNARKTERARQTDTDADERGSAPFRSQPFRRRGTRRARYQKFASLRDVEATELGGRYFLDGIS